MALLAMWVGAMVTDVLLGQRGEASVGRPSAKSPEFQFSASQPMSVIPQRTALKHFQIVKSYVQDKNAENDRVPTDAN
ncbi:hypothetical protein [Aliiroseovarius sp.]|uniref:hypothetical protein n=1 Tax=Aliiroseovarius sp. TaxID=1872442 RepID=UPI003BAD17FC